MRYICHFFTMSYCCTSRRQREPCDVIDSVSSSIADTHNCFLPVQPGAEVCDLGHYSSSFDMLLAITCWNSNCIEASFEEVNCWESPTFWCTQYPPEHLWEVFENIFRLFRQNRPCGFLSVLKKQLFYELFEMCGILLWNSRQAETRMLHHVQKYYIFFILFVVLSYFLSLLSKYYFLHNLINF